MKGSLSVCGRPLENCVDLFGDLLQALYVNDVYIVVLDVNTVNIFLPLLAYLFL